MNNYNDRRYRQTEDSFILDDLHQMENATNYNKWLYKLIKPFLGRRVIEVGPGIGNISQQVIEDVDLLVGIEPNQYCANVLEKTLKNKSHFILVNKNIENCNYNDLKQYNCDTILCVNVLEHIEDDISTLYLFKELLKPKGRIVLLVPAIPNAYGPIDKAVGHFRRYNKTSMREVLGKTSLKIIKIFYSNFWGLWGWLYNSKIRKSTSQSDFQIKLFDKIVPLVSFVESKIGCPVGLSLISISEVENE